MTDLIAVSWELTHLAAGRSRGRQDAEDWLERNSPESFESNEDWMRAREGNPDEGYTTWHPREDDYTYEGLGDAAGQHFDEHGDQALAMPGHFRTENVRLHQNPSHTAPSWEDSDIEIGRSWTPQELEDHEGTRQPLTHQFPDDHEGMDGVEDDDVDPEFERMAEHGFNWEPLDHTAGTPGNPLSPETPGRYVRHQHTPEGDHIATHVIQNHAGTNYPSTNRPLWTLDSNIVGGQAKRTNHTSADDALDRYRQNSAEILLPSRGYEPDRGRTGWARSWHRTSPNGHQQDIEFPEEGGFAGVTNGTQVTNQHDLADIVRTHDRIGELPSWRPAR